MPDAITRRDMVRLAAAAPLGAPLLQRRRPPNFLYILCDQLSLAAISAHGNPHVRTPNLDRLIARGVSFQESHSTNPVCSPARSSLMTGRMPVETGVVTNGVPITAGIPNIGEWLRGHGYETVYCGKWHLPDGWAQPGMPGFTVLPLGGGGQGSSMDSFNAMACEAYLRNRSRNAPFLLVSSLMEPHDICYWCLNPKQLVPRELPFPELAAQLPPLPPNHTSRPKAPQVLERLAYKQFDDNQWRYYLYCYYRQVEMLDCQVGRILNALEASGEAESTVVVFTSDHGEGGGHHMHVQKWYPYEEAVKVPMVVSWPGHIREGHRDAGHLVSGLDVVSTLCDYAGAPQPPHARGRSLRPLAEGRSTEWREFVSAEVRGPGRVLRTERFKYVRFPGDPVEQLFDMKSDPWEMKNLYEDPKYADTLAQHRKLLDGWLATLIPAPGRGKA